MKLEEAIELLADFQRRFPVTLGLDDHAAVKLGIEALKAIEKLHHLPYGSPLPLLPGETPKEET